MWLWLLGLPVVTGGCGAVRDAADTVQIQMAIYTPLCMEVKDASTAEGQIVQTYPCVTGERRQEWSFVPLADAKSYFVVNANSGMCMTVTDGRAAPSTPVLQAPCYTPTQASQTWAYTPAPAPMMGYRLVSGVSGLCLDIEQGATAGETPLQVYTCKPMDPAQGFVLAAVPHGTTH